MEKQEIYKILDNQRKEIVNMGWLVRDGIDTVWAKKIRRVWDFEEAYKILNG